MNTEVQNLLLSLPQSKIIPLSSDTRKAIENIRTCRTQARGGMVLECPECGTKAVFYNPCNQRGCPLCYQKNQLIWKQRLQERILPTSHYHLVFSMPQVFTNIWLHEKRKTISSLFACVAAAIKELGEREGILLGSALAFHSHGKGLTYKPHIHCLLTSGGSTNDLRWVGIGSIKYTLLLETVKNTIDDQLRRNGIPSELLPDYGKIRDDEWNLHPAFHKESGNQIVEYLSHAMHGVVTDLTHDVRIDHQSETVEVTTRHYGNETTTILSVSLFVERYLQHIPPPGVVMVRYYGLYSNSHAHDLEYVREYSFKGIYHQDTGDGQEEEECVKEKCPNCHTIMKFYMEIPPTTSLDLTYYGFTNGPPKHMEVIRIA